MKATYTIIFISFVLAGILYGRYRVSGASTGKSVGMSSLIIAVGILAGIICYYIL